MAHWFQPLKTALGQPRPAPLLVANAGQEALGELVDALLPEHPEVEVHTDARRLLDAPPEHPVVLVLREEDIDGLRHPLDVITRRGPSTVLFCDAPTTRALERRAKEVLAGVSLRLECPSRPPHFAVQGLRQALAVRAPGVVWKGGNLPATFAAARPHGRLHELSAALPYAALVAELRAHPREWIAWTGVDSHLRLRRVRQAHAEVGHRTRAILVEPALECPGWWPVHGQMVDARTARERMERAGASLPGQVAALNHFEPEALSWTEEFLRHGLDAPTAEAGIVFMAAPEGRPDPSLRETAIMHGRRILRGEADPPVFRVFRPRDLRGYLREQLALLTRSLEGGGGEASLEDLASWTAWARNLPVSRGVDALVATLATRSPELAAELLLARHGDRPEAWNQLASWALEWGDTEAAIHWAHRARDNRAATNSRR